MPRTIFAVALASFIFFASPVYGQFNFLNLQIPATLPSSDFEPSEPGKRIEVMAAAISAKDSETQSCSTPPPASPKSDDTAQVLAFEIPEVQDFSLPFRLGCCSYVKSTPQRKRTADYQTSYYRQANLVRATYSQNNNQQSPTRSRPAHAG